MCVNGREPQWASTCRLPALASTPSAAVPPARCASPLLPRWWPPLPQVLYRAAKQRFDEEEDFKTRVSGWFVSFGGCWSLFGGCLLSSSLEEEDFKMQVGREVAGCGGLGCWWPYLIRSR